MVLKKSIFVLVLFLLFSNNYAQEFKLGKVTLAELEEKYNPRDTSAVATILYKKGRTFFTYHYLHGFEMNHEIAYRIKIYKKEGLKWATWEVPYYTGYKNFNDDSIIFDDAVTYNIVDGAIVKTKLNSEGNFNIKINGKWKMESITLPNVKVGSIIEFRYKMKSENIMDFPAFDMQYAIPLNYAEYKTEIPGYLYYKSILKGYVEVKMDSEYKSGSINYADKDSQTISMNFQSLNSTYKAKEVPAIKEEEFVDNMENYKASINNELEKVQFQGSEAKNYALTWDGVAQTIYKNDNFRNQLNDEIAFLVTDVKSLLVNIESPAERLKIIFDYVQAKMNWNHQQGYYTDKGVEKAYLDRTGNVAEINFILIAMLRLAGINTDPVLISTLDHGIPVFPSYNVFNYVVARAEINGEQILLDASHKYTSPNILPLNTLNWMGLVIKRDETTEEVNLVTIKPSVSTCNLTVEIDPSGRVLGDLKSAKSRYEAYNYRSKFADIKTEDYVDKLENLYNDIEISNYAIENKTNNLDKPIEESFTFQSNNQFDIIGGKIFLNPLLFLTTYKNPFVQENRKTPIYFGYPIQKKYMVNIEIPEGYEIESMPKGINMSSIDGTFSFKYLLEKRDDKIQIVVNFEIKNSNVDAENYAMLKEFYQKMIDKENEKIVLKKI